MVLKLEVILKIIHFFIQLSLRHSFFTLCNLIDFGLNIRKVWKIKNNIKYINFRTHLCTNQRLLPQHKVSATFHLLIFLIQAIDPSFLIQKVAHIIIILNSFLWVFQFYPFWFILFSWSDSFFSQPADYQLNHAFDVLNAERVNEKSISLINLIITHLFVIEFFAFHQYEILTPHTLHLLTSQFGLCQLGISFCLVD